MNDILENIDKEIIFFNFSNFHYLLNQNDLINNNILIINDNYEICLNIAKTIQPLIIILCSDESGNNHILTELSHHSKVIFRQYNHSHYNYPLNNYHLPLGYVKNFLNGKLSEIYIKSINERYYNCSFIGARKSDRSHMAKMFEENMEKTNIIFVENNWNVNHLPYSPKDCFDIYNNSIFVIIGRGWSNLNCFRIYEAIVAGAIPVLSGSDNEIKSTFIFRNNIIPFVYDESWEKVIIKSFK